MTSIQESVVNACYLVYFGRPADPSGLAFWVEALRLANGDPRKTVEGFGTCAEATGLVRGNTPTEIIVNRITDIYHNLFNRAPDEGGLKFWLQAVQDGHTTWDGVALEILNAARGTDLATSTLRQQAAADFTRSVSETGIDFSGASAIEASHALIAAVTATTTQASLAEMVKAAGILVDNAHDHPAVTAVLGIGGKLTPLFSMARGLNEAADLLQALADISTVAADDPAKLESLLRGGGMEKVLTVMPAKATLQDVIDALAKGGLPAAVEVVYPSTGPGPGPGPGPDPDPGTDPGPTFVLTFNGGILTISGSDNGAAVVDLSSRVVLHGAASIPVGGGAGITAVVWAQYAGPVTLSGTVAEIGAVLPQSSDAAYRIADSENAIFTGPPTARTLVAGIADLVAGADMVTLTGLLSAQEFGLLSALPGFDAGKLHATVDLVAPVAGVLGFGGLGLADPNDPQAVTNQHGFSLQVSGAEAGATVGYQLYVDNQVGWVDLASPNVAGLGEGSYTYRAVVVDAAGNVSYTAQATITIDTTAPVIMAAAFGANDGELAAFEAVTLEVSFDSVVFADGGVTLQLANGGSAVYLSGSGSNKLVFQYVPAPGQSTATLALAPTGALGGIIADRAGNPLSATAFDGIAATNAPAVDTDVPVQTFTFTTISQSGGDSASVAGTGGPLATNLITATVNALLSAVLGAGEHVEYSADGGQTWSVQGLSVAGTAVAIGNVATASTPLLMLRVVNDNGSAGSVASHAIVFDTAAPDAGTLSFASVTEGAGDSLADNVTNAASVALSFQHAGAWPADGEALQYSTDGVTWHTAGLTVDQGAGAVTIAGIDLTLGTLDGNGNRTTTVQVRAVDSAGNITPVASQVLVYDNSAGASPVVTLDSDTGASDGITSVGTFGASGIEAGGHVEYSLTGSGGWSTTVPVAAQGVNTIHVRQVDAAGNASGTTILSFTLDSLAPTAPGVALAADTGVSNADGITNAGQVLLSGLETGGAGAWQYSTDGGTNWQTGGAVAGDGTASVTITGDGAHTVLVRQYDTAGNVSNISQATFTIDTSAPAVTAIDFGANDGRLAAFEAVTVEVSFDSVVFADGGVALQFANGGSAVYLSGSGSNKLVFQYVPAPGQSAATLALAANGALAGVIANVAGNPLAATAFDGHPVANAPAVDTDTASQTITFTTISQSGGDSASVAGTGDPLATNLATATVKALLSATLGSDEHVEYSADGGQSWSVQNLSVAGTAVTIGNVATASTPLLMLRIVDDAGNAAPATSRAIVHDTTAPDAGTLVFAGVTQGAGDSLADNVTNVAAATLSFQHAGAWPAAGEVLQYSTDGVTWRTAGLAIDQGTGAVTIAGVDLTLGTLDGNGNRTTTVQVRAVDAAGNITPVTSQVLVYDSSAGAAPTVTLDSDTGASDGITGVGTFGASGIEAGGHVEYSLTGSGGWSTTVPVAVQGVNTFHVRQVDAAGNASGTTILSFTLDSLAPTAPGVALAADTGVSNADGITNAGQVLLSGLETGGAGAWQYSTDGGTNWQTGGAVAGDGTASVTITGDGAHTVLVRQYDTAGNVSNISQATFTIDTSAPAVTAIDFGANDGRLAAFEAVTVEVSFDSVVFADGGVALQFANGGSAVYLSGSGSNKLVFQYVPAPGQSAATLALAANGALAGVIANVAGNPLAATAFDGHPVANAPAVDTDTASQTITFTTISQSGGDSASVAGTGDPLATNLATATVKALLSATLGSDEHVEYSADGGQSWSVQNLSVAGTAVTIGNVATASTPLLMLRIVDDAGNAAPATSRAIVHDTTAPDAGTLVFAGVTQGAGDSQIDNVTNVAAATLSFQHAGAWPAAGEALQYSTDGVTWRTAGLAIDQGTGAVTIAGVDLTLGTLDGNGNRTTTVQVRAVDAAGNITPVTSQVLVYDSSAGAAPGVTLDTDTAGAYGSASDGVTSVGTFTVSGIDAGNHAEYSLTGSGGWSTTVPVAAQGANTIHVRQVDVAGNASAATLLGFTLDTLAPSAPGAALAADTGDSNADNITKNGQVRVSGLETGGASAWEYSVNGGLKWQAGGAVAGDGTASVTLTGDGVHTVLVRQHDTAGNVSGNSTLTFTLDTEVPEFSFDYIEGSTDDPYTTDLDEADAVFSYVGELGATDVVEYQIDGGAWVVLDPAAIDTGAHTITLANIDLSYGAADLAVRVTDVAGNTSALPPVTVLQPYFDPVLETSPSSTGLTVTSPLAGALSLLNESSVLRAVRTSGGSTTIGAETPVVLGAQTAMEHGLLRVTTDEHGDLRSEDDLTYWLGTNGADTIAPVTTAGIQAWGFGGIDVMNGGDASDTLYGGAQNDKLNGGHGSNTLIGGAGADLIDIVKGENRLLYANGESTVGSYDTVTFAGAGANVLAQSFKFGVTPTKLFNVTDAANPATTSAASLAAALDAAYLAASGGSGAAGVVRFVNGDTFLVCDTGNGAIDNGDYVVKLVGHLYTPTLTGGEIVFASA
ncbi:Ig-like domain-containing protein [Pseudoduganella dura]|uniref:Ig-like domain-containing protein n=1 Tax=Pseudoduganella dura TaxID=321982 RepID=UPI0016747EC7|nr:Ig-like domain-containing protein [Pseudoduganella dura]GGY09358.1 hypothetical protein GCM10007386_44720 [Pseudoduganella dura]